MKNKYTLIIRKYGTKVYLVNNKLHRDNEPAVIYYHLLSVKPFTVLEYYWHSEFIKSNLRRE